MFWTYYESWLCIRMWNVFQAIGRARYNFRIFWLICTNCSNVDGKSQIVKGQNWNTCVIKQQLRNGSDGHEKPSLVFSLWASGGICRCWGLPCYWRRDKYCGALPCLLLAVLNLHLFCKDRDGVCFAFVFPRLRTEDLTLKRSIPSRPVIPAPGETEEGVSKILGNLRLLSEFESAWQLSETLS